MTPSPRPGGRILADALVAQGIDTVFLVPGESFLDVLDGLHAVGDRVRVVTCRFEAGAVHMAEAYGKLHGRPALLLGEEQQRPQRITSLLGNHAWSQTSAVDALAQRASRPSAATGGANLGARRSFS